MLEPVKPDPDETPVVETPPDRRKEDRFPCYPPPFIRLLIRPSFQCIPAFVANVASTSLGVLLDDPLEPGTVMALEMKGVERGQTNILSAKVVHCTPRADGFWLVGCQLNRPLTDTEWAFLRGEGRHSRP